MTQLLQTVSLRGLCIGLENRREDVIILPVCVCVCLCLCMSVGLYECMYVCLYKARVPAMAPVKTPYIIGSTPDTGIVCNCIGFGPLPSQCVSYTAEFIIICTGYNKQSLMLHCLQSWCVSSSPPLSSCSQSADWLLWSGSHCAWPGWFLSHMRLILSDTFLGKWLLF